MTQPQVHLQLFFENDTLMFITKFAFFAELLNVVWMETDQIEELDILE